MNYGGKLYEPISESHYTAIVEKWFEVRNTQDGLFDVWLGIRDNTLRESQAMNWVYLKSDDLIVGLFTKMSIG